MWRLNLQLAISMEKKYCIFEKLIEPDDDTDKICVPIPNASSLVNEVFIMCNNNKYRAWLSKEVRHKEIVESQKEGRSFRKQFKKRLSDIEKKRLELQEENKTKEIK
ncbi:hypothetical protein KUTeg_011705 [Tegillarca granosa]|uniref:Uncharacterized protein n=1 Tax=Tegillarca granosa TaxID=220873 RepID=A0ABQ9F2M5_TEGGR|nr:hypothetical protein KUTeg_011705 [Tegillarca granosa]